MGRPVVNRGKICKCMEPFLVYEYIGQRRWQVELTGVRATLGFARGRAKRRGSFHAHAGSENSVDPAILCPPSLSIVRLNRQRWKGEREREKQREYSVPSALYAIYRCNTRLFSDVRDAADRAT